MTVKDFRLYFANLKDDVEITVSDSVFDLEKSIIDCFSVRSFKTDKEHCVLIPACKHLCDSSNRPRSIFSFSEGSKNDI